ncbi:MAG: hypothetical protein H0U03_10530 [Actinobacteria bacterium]|nr:hypothetical protein [Actinomycetota bacterium]
MPRGGSDAARLRQRLGSEDDSVRLNAALDLADLSLDDGVSVLVEALAHPWPVVRRSFARRALVSLGRDAVPALERATRDAGTLCALGASLALVEIDSRRRSTFAAAIRGSLADGGSAAEDAVEFLWDRPEAAIELCAELQALVARDVAADTADWDRDPRIRAALLLARTAGADVEVHSALIRLVADETAHLRWAGALALGHAGFASAAAIRALGARTIAEDEAQRVRVAAAFALARIGDPDLDTIPALGAMLGSGQPWLRVSALRIAGEMASAEPRFERSEVFYRWTYSAHPVAQAANRAGVLGWLLAALEDTDANVRRNAILALSWCGDPKDEAARALSAFRGERYFESLAEEARTRLLGRDRPLDAEPSDYGRMEDFYLQVPIIWTNEKLDRFRALHQRACRDGPATELGYDLPYPKHEFLRYLCDEHGLLLHGSEKTDLEVLKPLRSSTDSSPHGNVSGVYGEPDPIRPIYFAVVDKKRSFGLINTCFALDEAGGEDTRLEQPDLIRYYRLSVGVLATGDDFWREGTVYALPRESFTFWEEWTSRAPVRPVLKLSVARDDLPLKDHVWGADLRKPGDFWVDPRKPYPYLEDVWALPLRTLP